MTAIFFAICGVMIIGLLLVVGISLGAGRPAPKPRYRDLLK